MELVDLPKRFPVAIGHHAVVGALSCIFKRRSPVDASEEDTGKRPYVARLGSVGYGVRDLWGRESLSSKPPTDLAPAVLMELAAPKVAQNCGAVALYQGIARLNVHMTPARAVQRVDSKDKIVEKPTCFVLGNLALRLDEREEAVRNQLKGKKVAPLSKNPHDVGV